MAETENMTGPQGLELILSSLDESLSKGSLQDAAAIISNYREAVIIGTVCDKLTEEDVRRMNSRYNEILSNYEVRRKA